MLKGKTAVITGGSRGIGRAVALKLAGLGADVAIIYAGNEAAAGEVCQIAAELGVRAMAYRCDVSDFDEAKAVCAQIFTDFGRIDILVNNAGITKDALLLTMSERDFNSVIDVNLKGAFHLIRHLSRHLMKAPAGRIVNISSVIGLTGNVGQANYASAKAGLIGLTKTAARELAPRGVTCNAIAPGFIETDMTANLPPKVRESITSSIPLKRLGSPEDVSDLAAFLVSEAAAYITGEVIRVDGGMCI